MLQRTLSTLGHVVRRRRPADAPEPLQTERRVWVRYPCEVEASCQPANAPDALRLSARVRDISRGGIHFLVNCPVESGALLSVELPAPAGRFASTVLAYVVRVQPLQGEWSVGCTFACELNDDDLEPFGARRVKPRADDQRTWVRFPCQAQASYQLVQAPGAEKQRVQVLNLSANGVGLRNDRPIDLGRLLNLELRSPRGPFILNILACVVRTMPRDSGDWVLGCNLIRELSDQELKALL